MFVAPAVCYPIERDRVKTRDTFKFFRSRIRVYIFISFFYWIFVGVFTSNTSAHCLRDIIAVCVVSYSSHIKLDGFQERKNEADERHMSENCGVHPCTDTTDTTDTHTQHPRLCSVKLRGKIRFKVRTTNDAGEIEMLCLWSWERTKTKKKMEKKKHNLKHINRVYSFLWYLVS